MATFALIENNRVQYKTADFDLQNLDFYLKSSHSFFILNNEESSEDINALYIEPLANLSPKSSKNQHRFRNFS